MNISAIAQIQHITPDNVVGAPGFPGPVTGAGSAIGGNSSTYSVTAATNATSYNWTVTAAAGTISGNGLTATVQWNTSFNGSAVVGCAAINSSGSSLAQSETVAITEPTTTLVSGVVSPAIQNVGANGTPGTITSTAASGGNGIYSYQWQNSLNNGIWTNITGANSSSYSPSLVATSTYYRLITTSSSMSVTSNMAFVNSMVSSSYSPSNNLVSVNELTGTANVIIPLYTIEAAHTTFPINLIYSATGIKGTDVEGSAGMGWNVSLGGAVTRQLRGLPDDVTQDSNGNGALGWLYANNGSAINTLSFANDNNTSTCADEGTDIGVLAGAFLGNTDTEPDIFQVNAPGLSCQLVFDKNNTLQVIPYQDLKISYVTSPQGNSDQKQITSFTITNDRGVTYVFSATSNTIQKATTTQSSVNYFQSNYNHYKNGITYYSSWSLTSISDIHNNNISISYIAAPVATFSNPIQLSLGGAALTTLYTMSGTVNSRLVSGISYENAVAGQSQGFQVTYGNTPMSNKSCISSIIGMGHDIILGYNNVTTNDGGITYTRLFLNSVIDEVCSAQTVNGQTVSMSSYAPLNLTFNYLRTGSTVNTTSSLAGPTSNHVDYWGYTNSFSTNTSLLPSIDINPAVTSSFERYRNRQISVSPPSTYTYAISGANRETDIDCSIGSLSQINYSAGGYTSLSYEPNDYYDNTASATVEGGGIRVTQVLDHDGISTDHDFIRTYVYRDPSTEISTGRALSLPIFAFTTPYSGANTGSTLWTSSTMISPVDLSGEDHSILYGSVTETINNTGSTVYNYALPATNWDTSVPVNPFWSPIGLPAWNLTNVNVGRTPGTGNSCQSEGVLRNDVNTYPFPPNTNYDFERGRPTNVLKYNNTGTLVSELDYYYQTPQSPVDIQALKYDANSYATNYAKYTIHTSSAPLLTQVVSKVFDLTGVAPGSQSNVAQVVTTNNIYNGAEYKLSQQAIHNSDGSINITNIKYTKDFVITKAGDSYLSNLAILQSRNLNIPIETYTQFTPVNSTQAVITGADLILYGTFANQGPNGLTGSIPFLSLSITPGPAPLQYLRFTSVIGTTLFSPASVSNTNTFQYDSKYTVAENDLGYDYSGFLLSKDDGFNHVKTTIYDNFNSYRVRAVITNARFDEVGIDYPISHQTGKFIKYTIPPNAYDFVFTSTNSNYNISSSSVTRNGIQALTIPATTILSKTLNKTPTAKNYVFSIWVNTASTGKLTVSATDGTNSVSEPFTFDATAGNSKYPTGFEYCQVTIPLATLTASPSITISFSCNADINCTDILTYPDIADITTYAYDNNDNKIAATNVNGVSIYYSYDGLGRLLYTYDQDNNIIQRKTYVNTNAAINSLPGVNLSWTSPAPGYYVGQEYISFATVITGSNTCTFNGNTTYTWNFGDGTTSSGPNLVTNIHKYTGNAGQKFTCTLTITAPNAAPFSTSSVVTL